MSKTDKINKLAEKGKSDKLVPLVDNKKPEIHLTAIAALGEIGDDTALNTLVALLRDPNPDKRAEAVKALAKVTLRDPRNSAAKTHLQHLKNNEKDEKVKEALDEAFNLISQNHQSA